MGAAGLAAALGAVAGSYVAVRSGRAERFDAAASRRLDGAHGPALDRAIAWSSDLGSIYGAAGISLALAAAGRRSTGVDVAGSSAIAWLVAQSIKPLLPRTRPYESGTVRRLVAPPAGTSWPSGHAAVAAAAGAAVAPRLGRRARFAVAATAVGVGVSRLHVGVHHLTDVVAGLGVGVLSTAVWRALRRDAAVRCAPAAGSRVRRYWRPD